MNRQDANKWARAIRLGSVASWSIDALADMLEREFPDPASLCHVCKSPLNGDTCPKCQPKLKGKFCIPDIDWVGTGWKCQDCGKHHTASVVSWKTRCMPECQPEAPPDVSALRFEGKAVEIIEPQKRYPKKGEIFLDETYYRPDRATVDFKGFWRWILRIKEQPPLSVYGCDPRKVSLEGLKGPNGKPVEWVDFRGLNHDDHEELFVLYSRYAVVRSRTHGPLSDPDKRRIIVREVEERKPRRFIVTPKPGHEDHHFAMVHPNRDPQVVGELADLDDPKVLDMARIQAPGFISREQTKYVIEAYLGLEYPCKS